jgi:hypothetical protein
MHTETSDNFNTDLKSTVTESKSTDPLIFYFSATECNGWPKLKFIINDTVLLDVEFESSQTQIVLPLDNIESGLHTLKIERYGKTHNNCQVENGTIVKDQTVTLEDIYIADVKLPNYIKYSGVFCFNDTEHPQSLIWGPNGMFKMSVGIPVVSWAVQEKINRSVPVLNLFVPLPEARQRFFKNLNEFEKELANVKV